MLHALILGDLLQEIGLLLRLLADDPDTLTYVRAVLGAAAIHVPLLPDDVEDLARALRERYSRHVGDRTGSRCRQRVLVVAPASHHPADQPHGAAADADLEELLCRDDVGQERQE